MRRQGIVIGLLLACAPAMVSAQSLSLNTATTSGDCTGTSFHQNTDASGRYLAAEWAVAGQFPVPVNRGRVRCTVKVNVQVQTGYKIALGGMSGNSSRMALTQFAPLRLNGASAGILVESSYAFDAGTPVTASAISNSGPTIGGSLVAERPAGAPVFESVCSTATKSTFQISTTIEVAAASNYVAPWPPEPYAERETANMGGYRLFYTVVPCPTGRTAAPSGLSIRP